MLHFAAINGHKSVAEWLIAQGVALNGALQIDLDIAWVLYDVGMSVFLCTFVPVRLGGFDIGVFCVMSICASICD